MCIKTKLTLNEDVKMSNCKIKNVINDLFPYALSAVSLHIATVDAYKGLSHMYSAFSPAESLSCLILLSFSIILYGVCFKSLEYRLSSGKL